MENKIQNPVELNNTEDFLNLYSSSIAVFNIRFSHYLSKISICLNDIENQFRRPCDTEYEENVVTREIKMAAEFGRRFSRINLYSIQLELKKLECGVERFMSLNCCKLAEAFILRSLVISLLKYLQKSFQMYLKFLKKCKIRVSTKLTELLNYLIHSYEIIRYVVDHQSLRIYDLPKMCSSIVDNLQSHKLVPKTKTAKSNKVLNRSVQVVKRGVVKKPIESNRKKVDVLKKSVGNDVINYVSSSIPKDKCEISSGDKVANSSEIVVKKPLKNVCFEMYKAESDGDTECDSIKHHLVRKENIRMELCTSAVRLCEAVLNGLIVEVLDDITECIRSLATETFDQEFNNSQ